MLFCTPKLSKQQRGFLKDLNEFYLRSRYPDLIYKPLPKTNKKALVKDVRRDLENYIQENINRFNLSVINKQQLNSIIKLDTNQAEFLSSI